MGHTAQTDRQTDGISARWASNRRLRGAGTPGRAGGLGGQETHQARQIPPGASSVGAIGTDCLWRVGAYEPASGTVKRLRGWTPAVAMGLGNFWLESPQFELRSGEALHVSKRETIAMGWWGIQFGRTAQNYGLGVEKYSLARSQERAGGDRRVGLRQDEFHKSL
jgi:hypothetical protein